MATFYINRVNHKLYTNNYFSNLDDSEKDKVYYRVYGKDKPDSNYKQFIIEQPKIRLQLTDYLFNLIKDEMFFDNFHDIKYKRVTNKEFHRRIKSKQCQKFRFYYEDRWITYYFNTKTKHKIMESDIPVNLAIYASYPAKGLNNFLLQPCQVEGSEGMPPPCYSFEWKICTMLKDLSSEEDYCSMNPQDKTCYSPPYKVSFDDYFYTKPGQKDYLIEAITIDYDKGLYKDKCSEYYILDREGDYFKKAHENANIIKQKVLEKFNKSPNRIELFIPETKERKIIAYKTNKKFKSFEDLFKYLGRSWIGRLNAFFFQWNQYMKYFNSSDDGYYCPPHSLFVPAGETQEAPPPPMVPMVDGEFMNKNNDTLLQEKIEGYVPPKLEVTVLTDIKVFTMFDYLKFYIAGDKNLEALDINADTLKDLKKYTVNHYQVLDNY